MIKSAMLLLFTLCNYTGFCQSADSAKVKPAVDSIHYTDTVHYYLNYASTGIINNANSTRSYVLTNAFKFSVSKKSGSLNAFGSWIYGEQQKQPTNNDFSAGLDFDLYKSIRHFYYWGLANYTTSYSLKVNGQLQTGVGAGYNVIDKKTINLVVSDGILYEKGDLYDILYNANGINEYRRDVYDIVRNSFRILFHWSIKDIIVLDGTEFLQQSLASGKDYIIKSTQSISFKLNKWLSYTTSLTYNKFTRTGSENLLLNFGLTIDKHF